jgi:two-component system, cell cycle sensor histidine kinase and response regulator CckA
MDKVSHGQVEFHSAGVNSSPALRVLILEDSARDAEVCISELIQAGFDVDFCTVDTKRDFAVALHTGSYDLILSDYQIPSWSGAEAFRLLKESGKDIPFILVTGTLGDEAAVDLIKEGVADYILKDRLVRLPSAVRRVLGEKTARDERERAIQSLRESEEQVRLLLDSAAEAIFGLDLVGNCTFSNAAALRLLGYNESGELAGNQMHILTHQSRPEGRPYPIDECRLCAAFRQGEHTHSDDQLLWRKNGSSFPVECWSHPVVSNGKKVGSVVTFLDITERKRSEQELRKSEARVRHLVQSNIIGISIGTLDGKIIEANDAFLHLLGYSNQDLHSGIMRWDNLTPPAFRSSDDLALEQLKQNGVASPWETQFFRKDGSRVSVLIGVTSLVADDGGVECVSFVVDISERKVLEQQLRQSQKMEAIGQLAGGIAHDFNNLLSVIIGYSELLIDRPDGDVRMRGQCEQIKKAGERAASLTRQLLAFSRQQVLTPQVLSLNGVIKETEKMLRRLIGEDIELKTALEPKLGPVKADAGQIEQIIMNLVVNARDAMPDGGTLTIETSNVVFNDKAGYQPSPLSAGRYALLAVSDTGIGMDQETKSHIFEPFFTTKELGKGTGLGLSTVYGVVKQSGGSVFVHSELGHGTVFTVYLPMVDESTEQIKCSELGAEALRGTETLLLVEDDDCVRALARSLLVQAGYTVLEASQGVEAFECARQYAGTIHLLLTDIVMRGMSGRVLADKMMAVRPAIKVLFVSGYAGNCRPNRSLSDGEASVVEKPFSRKSLLSVLRKTLDVPTGPASDRGQAERETVERS